MEMTGEALVERTRALVKSLRSGRSTNAATYGDVGLACLGPHGARHERRGFGERTKQALIEQIKRLDDRGYRRRRFRAPSIDVRVPIHSDSSARRP